MTTMKIWREFRFFNFLVGVEKQNPLDIPEGLR